MNQNHYEEEYWLALIHAPGIGATHFARLVEQFGSPRAVFEAGHFEWRQQGLKEEWLKYLQNPDWFAVEKNMQWLAQADHHLLTLHHPDYPALLQKIDYPPPVLFVHGQCELLSSKQIAIVGTRHSTAEGEKTAQEFAEYLSHQGLTITSGMALGIDGAGHRGAFAASGKTIAVAGTGLDRVYPAQHRDLAHQIAEKGALVSEFPLGTTVKRSHFPRRSRVVSGLSLGTLVVEAPERSGALYTARHAVEQGREVFAIPGSIHNPLVKGCHKLIKEGGAKLVENVTDIIEELKIYLPSTPQKEFVSSVGFEKNQLLFSPTTVKKPKSSFTNDRVENSDLEPDYIQLLDYLGTGPTSIDNLVELSGLTAEAISSMLLILELRGLVVAQAGGLYARFS